MQALSVTTTENWSVCLGYYRRRGDAPYKKRYAYVPNGGALGACLETISYGYDAAYQDWADQLTSYNGETIRYDDSGNPISYRGYTMAWQGKRLTSATKSGTAVTYSYDENGIRTQKTVNSTTTNYYYNGSVLISQVTGNDTLLFSYDASGSVVSVNFNGTDYYYVRNGQGDVIKLIDGNGANVTEYTYDTWGKLLACTGSLSTALGTLNPFRYRGYVYDAETGFYYLQSRYYDPEVCRFLSADVLLSTGQGVLGYNTFAYCNNNPINAEDAGGCVPSYNVMETDGGGLKEKEVEILRQEVYLQVYGHPEGYYDTPYEAACAWADEYRDISQSCEYMAMIYKVNWRGKTMYTLGPTYKGREGDVVWEFFIESVRGLTSAKSNGKIYGMVHSHPEPETPNGYCDFPSPTDYGLLDWPYIQEVYVAPYKTKYPSLRVIVSSDVSSWYFEGHEPSCFKGQFN